MIEPTRAVLVAFDLAPDSRLEKLAGGKINGTWLVTDRKSRFILQSLNPIFTTSMPDTVASILDFLQNDDWEVSQVIRTKTGDPAVVSEDTTWRLSTYLVSDTSAPAVSNSLFLHAGELLSRLHNSLSKYPLPIPPTLLHYRDHTYHIDRLQDSMAKLSADFQDIASTVIQKFQTATPDYSILKSQPIHGDPKLANMLFRNQLPFTLIDWDTVMHHSPLVDIGDFARSTIKTYPDTSPEFFVRAFCESYHAASLLTISVDQLYASALISARAIELENTAKVLLDSEGQYWNTGSETSREAWLAAHAQKSLKLVAAIDTLLEV